MDEFLKQIANTLEMESVRETDELAALPQLDSMGVLSVIAMLDARYRVNLSTTDIGGLKTFGELWTLVQCVDLKKGCV